MPVLPTPGINGVLSSRRLLMDDIVKLPRKRQVGFWAAAVLAAVSAVLPFTLERTFILDVVVLGAPMLWLVAFRSASYFNREHRWWLWLAAPFALKDVVQGIFAILSWSVGGFAP